MINLDEEGKLSCLKAFEIAKFIGKKPNKMSIIIEAIYCQLAYFRKKKVIKMEIKVKVWIEDENRNLIFGSGKTEILNQIDQTGSIAKAAQNVGMNYKKAWSHIKILEEYIEDDLVLTKKGRAEDSGSKLTLKAKELIKLYKTLDEDIKEYSQKRFKELFLDREFDIVKESKNV